MKAASPYLTAAESAAYLRFDSVQGFYDFRYRLKKAGFTMRAKRRGRVLLFLQADLDRAMEQEGRAA